MRCGSTGRFWNRTAVEFHELVADTITALNGRPVRTTKELIDKLVESVGAKVAM